jgi:hypothetical protein
MRAKDARSLGNRFISRSACGAGDNPEQAVPAARAAHPFASSGDAWVVRNVLAMAGRIEPDPVVVRHWYRETSIAVLDELTAQALVAQGRAGEVLRFLRAILDQDD